VTAVSKCKYVGDDELFLCYVAVLPDCVFLCICVYYFMMYFMFKLPFMMLVYQKYYTVFNFVHRLLSRGEGPGYINNDVLVPVHFVVI